jgi:hypothetical protein
MWNAVRKLGLVRILDVSGGDAFNKHLFSAPLVTGELAV